MLSGYDAYALYMGLKLHFSVPKYNFFRYGGHVKHVTLESFERRPDRYFYHKLVRKYPDRDDLVFLFAANFFVKDTLWVRDCLTEEGRDIYLEKQRVKESLQYLVLGDIGFLRDQVSDFRDLFVVTDEYPLLLKFAMQGDIYKETLIVLNTLIGFLPTWETKITETIIFPTFKLKCERYTPFLDIDVNKFASAIKSHLTEHK